MVQPLTLTFTVDHSGPSVRLRDAQSGGSYICGFCQTSLEVWVNRFVSPAWASSVRGTGYGFKVRRDNQIAGVGGAGSGVQCGLDSRMHVPLDGI